MKWFEKGLNFDRWILVTVLALAFFGMVMIYSTSSVLAADRYHDGYYFLKKTLIALGLGLGLMIAAMRLDHNRLRVFGGMMLFISLLLLLIVFFFPAARGAHRWLHFGPFPFQPSEFAKLAIVIYLAHSLDKRQEKLGHFWSGVAPYLAIIGILVGIVLFEPDFGGALAIALLSFAILYTAGIKLKYLVSAGLAGTAAGLFFLTREEYRWQRLISFIDPWKYAKDEAFQLIQSFLAFGSGGLFGVGLGMSHQKMFYLPDAHTDFILSVIAEECGWVVVFAIIIAYAVFLTRGVWVALKSPNNYSRYLAMGLTLMIAMPAVINMAVVTGLLPTKGLVLPFLSYGGSSLIINMLAAGILLNVSAKRYQG